MTGELPAASPELSDSAPPSATNGRDGYPSVGAAAYVLGLLSVALLISYIDRQVLALLVEPIKASLKVSDTQIGALYGGGYVLVTAVVAVPVGRLVDTRNRRNLIIASMLAWSIMTCLCGLAANYWQLFGFRIGIGAAETSLAPAVFSLIADLYEPRRRVTANVAFLCVTIVGAAAAFVGGAGAVALITTYSDHFPALVRHLEPWRLTFLAVGLIGAPFALALLSFREPARKEQLARADGQPIPLREVRAYLHKHQATYFWIIPCLTAAGLGTSALTDWTTTILIRGFGTSAESAGTWVGSLMGACALSGIAVSGVLASRLGRRYGLTSILIGFGLGTLASVPFYLLLPFANSLPMLLTVFSLLIFTTSIGVGLTPSLVFSLSPNEMRGQLLAITGLFAIIVTAACPILIGFLSDHVFLGTKGLLFAVSAVSIAGVAASVLSFIMGYRPTAATLREMEARGSAG